VISDVSPLCRGSRRGRWSRQDQVGGWRVVSSGSSPREHVNIFSLLPNYNIAVLSLNSPYFLREYDVSRWY
jgi:hypothetical protein